MRNSAAINIGRQLRFDSDAYSLQFNVAETKNSRRYRAEQSDVSTPPINT